MAHTLPDYTTKYKTNKIYSALDIAELAVRLGGVSRFDRRGNILFYDDFEGVRLDWTDNGTGTGHDIQLTTEKSYMGTQSCKLITGDTAGDNGAICKKIAYPYKTKMGLETTLTVPPSAREIGLELYLYDGTYEHKTSMRYHSYFKTVDIWDDTGNWNSVMDVPEAYLDVKTWNIMKLVVDFEKEEYVRVLFNEREVDLSGLQYSKSSNTDAPYVKIACFFTSVVYTNIIGYVDNMILTQNE